MELSSQFECWRKLKDPNNSWGLTWFLAAEFCRRFYSSHGLVPWVIAHEGLGYYGIGINSVPCSVHGTASETLGRFTMGGNVENWQTGGPGDHGLKLIDECQRGTPTVELIRKAIAHFELPAIPAKSHIVCRHKRWGSSYVLVFEIAAYLALQFEAGELSIWNHPDNIKRKLEDRDYTAKMKEHPGAFLFVRNDRDLLVSGDGRFLDDSRDNLWQLYMHGQSVSELAKLIIGRLDA
ncbi:hypothetical protein BSZ31_15230 [Limnobacter sp. SAORIC-690]|uniref:hypothetical protein n=1 Tax=Limnobacter sp. SAORIC-690 TaxID=1923970 RepID=UPI000CF549E0|nr:hypothetical protein [Limnobacter sp. SAORIC-690]PQJ26095.1 hypothetical protein BSZ31_15230 [Limnobacter sp. SAORIC-690]